MIMTLTREQILGRKAGVSEVQLSDGTVKVRGLTRAEAAAMRGMDQDDVLALEAYAVSCAMVEPQLSPEDVAAWMASDAHTEIQKVIDAIEGKSAHGAGQGKAATKSVSGRRRGT